MMIIDLFFFLFFFLRFLPISSMFGYMSFLHSFIRIRIKSRQNQDQNYLRLGERLKLGTFFFF